MLLLENQGGNSNFVSVKVSPTYPWLAVIPL